MLWILTVGIAWMVSMQSISIVWVMWIQMVGMVGMMWMQGVRIVWMVLVYCTCDSVNDWGMGI